MSPTIYQRILWWLLCRTWIPPYSGARRALTAAWLRAIEQEQRR